MLGATIILNGEAHRVVGIMPAGFVDVMAPSTDVWAPLQARPRAEPSAREWGHHYRIAGRLKRGVDMNTAKRELASIASQPLAEFPRVPWASLDGGLTVRGLQDDITAAARPSLIAIIAAAVVLLVIACVNVANLLTSRR
jgi:hypothetical protein